MEDELLQPPELKPKPDF